ncbi:response regulator [Sediminibacterium sp.]|uniref:response regulator n=1 Tax=Sediminibacterium sp. TaxID=1917865 RepID=UPI003F6EBAE4
MSKLKPSHVLLVEDNEGDILLTTEALEDRALADKITVIRDGKLAIEFLDNLALNNSNTLPDIILLDINLPRKNGHQVLHHIKASPILKKIPVIMFTTSSSEKDITESYNNHANCFITKPIDADDFNTTMESIESFWMQTVTLPNNH